MRYIVIALVALIGICGCGDEPDNPIPADAPETTPDSTSEVSSTGGETHTNGEEVDDEPACKTGDEPGCPCQCIN